MTRWLRPLVLLAVLGGGPGAASAEPPTSHEIIYNRPSGFWTSNRPAEGGAYRWRLLGIGGGILGVTGLLVVRAIRKANAERAVRSVKQPSS